MQARVLVGLTLALALRIACSSASADQPRDYMASGLLAGDRLYLDYIGTGARATLERRRTIISGANDYTLNASALFGYPLAQFEVSAAVRMLFLEFSGTVGYRLVWRNLSFEPGEHGEYCKDCDRPARRAKDPLFGTGTGTNEFPFAEGRAQLYVPFNDHFVFTSLFALRYEALTPRSYDWFFTTVHDPGLMPRWEATGLFKHRKLGAIGPYLLLQSVPRAGHHDNEFAFGLNAMTRLGLVHHNDMLFITFLVRPGDGLYGVHSYFAPVRALIVYRLQLSL